MLTGTCFHVPVRPHAVRNMEAVLQASSASAACTDERRIRAWSSRRRVT